jgi:tetratricopeptide (TPR) repeat protein
MRQLSANYPDDLDAAVLYAESLMDLHPWDLWTPEGRPQSNTEEIVATLEGVLKRNARHTGANHFYIHAVEASLEPKRALESAQRLAGLAPNAGHLVHMPSHIFFRVGMYQEAAQSNAQAIEVDRKYIEAQKPTGPYPMMYYPHNIHFLWAARSMQGRGADAIRLATEVVEKLPADMVRKMPMIEGFLPTRLYALIQFEKWDEILKEPKPAPEFTLASGMWHYARGKAFATKGQAGAARQEQIGLQQNLAATPQNQLAMRHSVVRLLGLASRDLAGAVSVADGNLDAAISQLRVAVILQDGLAYDEPPAWFLSERQALGRLLIQANRASEAEMLFREDLQRYPANGWALDGLERSLRALKRASEADDVHQEFQKAWAGADFQIR